MKPVKNLSLRNSFSIVKNVVYMFCIASVICFSCNGQTKKGKETIVTVIHKEGNPKTDIKVNRKYDKKGNLISYDSTYTSYYSSKKRDKVLMDSLFREFKPTFEKHFPMVQDKYFNNLFFSDSLLYNDFFHSDFFKKRYDLNQTYMNQIFHEMDSVKNEFFRLQSKSLKK